ncbi:MAG: hypothetical protein V3U20_09965, partial [Thermoplasmata archaeon]
ITNGSIEMSVDGRPRNIAVFNTGGWVVDSKDAGEIIQSRPMPLLISNEGEIEPVAFSWPHDEVKIENKTMSEIINIIQKENF